MLPGFRFLFAAILLSTSVLVFALGAAALLRATHEQFVSNPPWRNGPQEQVFAQVNEPAPPVLAALRAEPVATEPAPSLRDRIPTIGLPASDADETAAVTPDIPAQPEAPEAAVRSSETPDGAPSEPEAEAAISPPADVAVLAAVSEDAAAATETTLAAPEPTAPSATAVSPNEAQQADTTTGPARADADGATAAIAALNDRIAAPEKEPPAAANTPSTAPDTKAAKPRAHRTRKHTRIARQPPPWAQPTFDLFAPQPRVVTAARTH